VRLLGQMWRGNVVCAHFIVEVGDLIMALMAIGGAAWAVSHFHSVLIQFVAH
jgi:hypothetical protein